MNQKVAISSAFGVVMTLVIAAGVGGYIYSQSLILDENETTPVLYSHESKQPSTLTTPQTVSQSYIPADWKTYRNEQYGFEVKYPSGWAIAQYDSQFRFSATPNSSGVQFTISGSSAVSDSEYKNLIKGCSQTMIGDLTAYKCSPGGAIPVPGAPYYWISAQDHLVGITDFYYGSPTSIKLISTFKFTK